MFKLQNIIDGYIFKYTGYKNYSKFNKEPEYK